MRAKTTPHIRAKVAAVGFLRQLLKLRVYFGFLSTLGLVIGRVDYFQIKNINIKRCLLVNSTRILSVAQFKSNEIVTKDVSSLADRNTKNIMSIIVGFYLIFTLACRVFIYRFYCFPLFNLIFSFSGNHYFYTLNCFTDFMIEKPKIIIR